ncbi:hypothetical protein RM844_08905 [Streptomyces sp. DSM 44915]|uniref:Uncharacterized protein n=1 Tax=Streptomyces chisholmiae TaxID=3075540 RepID=A0ABU2JN51_9ACTN|nr:hypothetical protein [Streptomyces sp. DSM 44915]MDT0266414.1 hypothetical protein [Streptomyces sp. DSM 44915]
MKWLDRKIKAYQDQAFETYAQMHDVPPEQRQATQQNIVQGAQGHYDPRAAAALSDPETAAYLALPQAEQLRQQQELQAYGQRLRALWETGTDAELTITSIAPTGVTLGGQRQYTIGVRVTGAGEPYQASTVQVVPAPVFAQYTVGARFRGKVNPGDRAEVGIFERIG